MSNGPERLGCAYARARGNVEQWKLVFSKDSDNTQRKNANMSISGLFHKLH